jgi:uroporphyrin-III C-methyltransferase
VTVYLVGAGPGDPELLTRKAARLLSEADVVIFDRLVSSEIVQEARADAVKINVGKHPHDGSASTDQSTINSMLVHYGRTGATVVRLKGGDPFLLGRGGEEVDALVEAQVPYEVVPGLSSSLAVPALAGIPVTHRGLAAHVTIASGHEVDGNVDWVALGALEGTAVLLMAVANRAEIARRMILGGRGSSTPVAVIESGSTAREHRVVTTLDSLGTIEVHAPAVIVIGDVAARIVDPEVVLFKELAQSWGEGPS